MKYLTIGILTILPLGCFTDGGDGGRFTAGNTTPATITWESETSGTETSGTTEGQVSSDSSQSTSEMSTTLGESSTETSQDSESTTFDTTETTLDPDSESDSTSDITTAGTTAGSNECAKIDFVFAIDNSPSMANEQAALTAAFPQFIETIMSEVTTTDYHIMVVDTDDETRCTADSCGGDDVHQNCDEYACMTELFDTCDSIRGAGVIHPAGKGASNMPCDPFGGNRYIIEGEPALNDTFVCMATVGTAGAPYERPMDALVNAVGENLNMPGSCNDGFLRDDAILVLTFISDDPHMKDTNSPMEAYESIIAAKGGDLDSIVVLGLIRGEEVGCPLESKPDAGKHWIEFIDHFGERGIAGPVCSENYTSFFQDAVETISDTCKINPPE